MKIENLSYHGDQIWRHPLYGSFSRKVDRMGDNRKYAIGVFGISRSGKDSAIEVFVDIARENGYDFVHMSPIGMIREKLAGRRLKAMPESEKIRLVQMVREEIRDVSEHSNVIVDEHYCFPHDFGGAVLEDGYYDEKLPYDIMTIPDAPTVYEVVLPRFATQFYDLVAVMKIDPDAIIERMRRSDGCKRNTVATRDDIIHWQRAEMIGVQHDALGRQIFQSEDYMRNAEAIWGAFEKLVCNNDESGVRFTWNL